MKNLLCRLADTETLLAVATSRIAQKMARESYETEDPASFVELARSVLMDKEREMFLVVFYDVGLRRIAHEIMFSGGLTSASVHVREIIKRCLEHNAAAVSFAHNHPGGTTNPSHQDLALTRLLNQACEIMDIRFLDHIVITPEAWERIPVC